MTMEVCVCARACLFIYASLNPPDIRSCHFISESYSCNLTLDSKVCICSSDERCVSFAVLAKVEVLLSERAGALTITSTFSEVSLPEKKKKDAETQSLGGGIIYSADAVRLPALGAHSS